MSIAIVTDSNSGFTAEEAKSLGIEIQPTPIIVDGQMYFEEEGFSREQFYAALADDSKSVSTSQPNPYDVAERWRRLLKTHDEVIYMPLSSGLSQTALTIKKMAETEEEFRGRVFALDNHRVSLTQKIPVYDCIKMVREGMAAKDIYDWLTKTAMCSSIYIAVASLKYLKKSGRLSPAAAMIGTLLKIKPVLQIQGEVLDKYAQVRKMSDAKKVMLDALKKDLEGRFRQLRESGKIALGVAHTQNIEEAQALVQELHALFPDVEKIYCDPLSISVSCHVGPGTLGCGCSIVY